MLWVAQTGVWPTDCEGDRCAVWSPSHSSQYQTRTNQKPEGHWAAGAPLSRSRSAKQRAREAAQHSPLHERGDSVFFAAGVLGSENLPENIYFDVFFFCEHPTSTLYILFYIGFSKVFLGFLSALRFLDVSNIGLKLIFFVMKSIATPGCPWMFLFLFKTNLAASGFFLILRKNEGLNVVLGPRTNEGDVFDKINFAVRVLFSMLRGQKSNETLEGQSVQDAESRKTGDDWLVPEPNPVASVSRPSMRRLDWMRKLFLPCSSSLCCSQHGSRGESSSPRSTSPSTPSAFLWGFRAGFQLVTVLALLVEATEVLSSQKDSNRFVGDLHKEIRSWFALAFVPTCFFLFCCAAGVPAMSRAPQQAGPVLFFVKEQKKTYGFRF